MSLTSPLLQIRTTIRNDKVFVRFKAESGKTLEVRSDLTVTNLSEFLANFYAGLDSFRKDLGNELEIVDLDRAYKALRKLHALGRQMNFQLFGIKRYEVENFVKQLHPMWDKFDTKNNLPPSVETVSSPEQIIPFHCFPLFDTNEPENIASLDNFIRLATSFLGFSMIIHRIIVSSGKIISGDLNKNELDNIDGLRLRFFQHAKLEGVKIEKDFFSRIDWIKQTGIFPITSLTKVEFVDQLANILWYASDNIAITSDQPIDQIHHFSCHCDTSARTSNNYTISLAHKTSFWGTPERGVTIGDLERKFGAFPQRKSKHNYPLIFLNACGTSKLNPNRVSSFPLLFLKIGNCGVIGTETPISDLFAAEFSKVFYLNVIKGKTVGESIYRTQWDMLKYKKNPSGILYTFYANPDLRVRKPFPEAILSF